MSLLQDFIDGDRAESDGLVKGVTVAVVSNNQDDKNLGRVKVRLPWNPQEESDWARVCAPMAGNGRGAWFLPEVGDEVLVAFDRGDPCHPYVIGSLWNGVDAPPADNKDGKNRWRRIRTRHGHELTFDDQGQHAVELRTQGGKRLTLDDQKIELTDENGNRLVLESGPGTLTLSSKTSLKLESQQIELAAGATLTLKGTSQVTIQGAMVNIN